MRIIVEYEADIGDIKAEFEKHSDGMELIRARCMGIDITSALSSTFIDILADDAWDIYYEGGE